MLPRSGAEGAAIDSAGLGAAAGRTRKAGMKSAIREMARAPIKSGAEGPLGEVPRLAAAQGLYDEFCAGFPYEETDDQRVAIDAALDDLASGRPMDRLVCGDVGFCKTEEGLRAVFFTVMARKQVAVVVPATPLALQSH